MFFVFSSPVYLFLDFLCVSTCDSIERLQKNTLTVFLSFLYMSVFKTYKNELNRSIAMVAYLLCVYPFWSSHPFVSPINSREINFNSNFIVIITFLPKNTVTSPLLINFIYFVKIESLLLPTKSEKQRHSGTGCVYIYFHFIALSEREM